MVSIPRRPLRPSGSAAFTIAELAIGIAISSLVATSTVWSLVSLSRSNTSSNQSFSRKEIVDRVLDLLQDETRHAVQVEVASSTSSLAALSNCSTTTTPLLILRGETSSEDISYAIRSTASDSRDWVGPNVLVRCGLPYSASDTLDRSASRSEQVVLDGLPANDGFVPVSGGSNKTTSNTTSTPSQPTGINRTLGLSLRSGTGPGSSNFIQVPISTNMAYDLAAQTSTTSGCTTAALESNGCEDTVRGSRLFRRGLGSSAVNGLPGTEDAVHFQGISRSEIRLSGLNGSGPCNSQYCEIRSRANTNEVTIVRDADVLIFRDDEVRL